AAVAAMEKVRSGRSNPASGPRAAARAPAVSASASGAAHDPSSINTRLAVRKRQFARTSCRQPPENTTAAFSRATFSAPKTRTSASSSSSSPRAKVAPTRTAPASGSATADTPRVYRPALAGGGIQWPMHGVLGDPAASRTDYGSRLRTPRPFGGGARGLEPHRLLPPPPH